MIVRIQIRLITEPMIGKQKKSRAKHLRKSSTPGQVFFVMETNVVT